MPEMSNILSEEDVNWIVKRHYENRYKLHIFSRDEKEDLEKILKATGKLDKIRENEEAHRKLHEEFLKKQAIAHTIRLREDYFECLEKANDFAAKDKPLHAVKEYGNAVRNYEEYFKSDYSKDDQKSQMPERKLTPKAVDNIMIIYKKNHPLLKSNRTNNRINEGILELLDGEWNDRLKEADREIQEILRQKQIEKQKKKEKMLDTAADVVVGARIAGDKIRGIFRK